MFCTDIRLSVLSFNCRPPPPMPANAVAGNNTGRGAVRLHAAAAPMSLGRSDPTVRTFAQLLVNVLLASFINFTIWFAITFFVYLETRSVFATGMIAGIFLVAMAGTGVWFGSTVDHHRKKSVIQASALVSLAIYAIALAFYLVTPAEEWRNPASIHLWVLIVLVMAVVVLAGAVLHLQRLTLPDALSHAAAAGEPKRVDLRGRCESSAESRA